MLKRIKEIIAPDSEFSKNFFVLFKGTVIAQIIPMVLMPVLTRIYTPEDFGILELFLAVSTILGTIANLRYELSIVLPDKKEDAWNIMGLGFILASIFSIGTLLIVSLFADNIAILLNNSKIEFWLYFVPLAVLLQGVFNMLSYYNTREKLFKSIAHASVSRSVFRTLTQISIGIIKNSPAGLIIGQLVGFAASIFPLTRKIKFKLFFKKINWTNMKAQAYKYRDFPKFTMPSTLANSTAVNMTSILISVLYSINSVGFYSLANRILGLPSALIGTSMSNVYYKEAHDQRKKFGNATEVFWSTFKKLALLSIPLVLVIGIFGEWLFAVIFGEEWRIAGTYARILIPLIAIRFVVAPLSVSLSVFEKQKISLLWQLGLLALSLIIFGVTWYLDWGIESFLILMVSVLSLYYMYFIYLLYRVVSGKIK
jgi:O-antigen/teichoic acid export membrane protein